MRLRLILAVFAVVVYALLWAGFRLHWGWVDRFDTAAMAPLYRYGVHHPGWVGAWNAFGKVVSPKGFRLVGLVVVVIAAIRRDLRSAVFVMAAIWLSGPLDQVAKALAHRPRPPGTLVSAAATSFPSGHALGSMSAVLALLTLSAGRLPRGVRWAANVVGALIVLATGIGRVVLNVHYPSDVVAGWALGYVWFLSCWLVFRPSPRATGKTPNAPPEQEIAAGRRPGGHRV
jgi:membrane-associated phospholipid phosphatase